jgi:hypothetical protein
VVDIAKECYSAIKKDSNSGFYDKIKNLSLMLSEMSQAKKDKNVMISNKEYTKFDFIEVEREWWLPESGEVAVNNHKGLSSFKSWRTLF